MKKIKFIIVLLVGLFMIPSFVQAQSTNDEVTLVVSADGTSKEEATKVALRSAIEQAYGTFVSANTTILNDELVKDEIVTITSGNIKQYKEIASERTPDGKTFVTLQATVCISKLVSYAKSKGASTEFAGAAFGMDMKMKELNKKNEEKALDNLVAQAKRMMPSAFNYELSVVEPSLCPQQVRDPNYKQTPIGNNDANIGDVDKMIARAGTKGKTHDDYYLSYFTIKVIPTEQMKNLVKYINEVCMSLSLSVEEIQDYNKKGIKTFPVCTTYEYDNNSEEKPGWRYWSDIKEDNCPFRFGRYSSKDDSWTEKDFNDAATISGRFRSGKIYYCISELNFTFGLNLYNFEIVDNLGGISYFGEYCLGIVKHDRGINLLALDGKNLFSLWSNAGCIERGSNIGSMNILTNYRHPDPGNDMYVYYDPTILPYRFSCYDAIPIRSLRPFELLKVPIFIPKNEIDKYSKFEIRKRNTMPKYNSEYANEILKLYFKCSKYHLAEGSCRCDMLDYNDFFCMNNI